MKWTMMAKAVGCLAMLTFLSSQFTTSMPVPNGGLEEGIISIPKLIEAKKWPLLPFDQLENVPKLGLIPNPLKSRVSGIDAKSRPIFDLPGPGQSLMFAKKLEWWRGGIIGSAKYRSLGLTRAPFGKPDGVSFLRKNMVYPDQELMHVNRDVVFRKLDGGLVKVHNVDLLTLKYHSSDQSRDWKPVTDPRPKSSVLYKTTWSKSDDPKLWRSSTVSKAKEWLKYGRKDATPPNVQLVE
ncbi:hypothetical protein BCV70DRAFT_239208 [Testicularia cyperi]|uniref:Uncharacterized protein n=1 Tax=Testicularia cyperi TaxID=1882483 RepID=A0A317XI76_9BASI|nr:hypothetical protein BCV70DRAFT_239208 [Testicularia cyperi]